MCFGDMHDVETHPHVTCGKRGPGGSQLECGEPQQKSKSGGVMWDSYSSITIVGDYKILGISFIVVIYFSISPYIFGS